jgi:micrococcal nuclease
MYEYQAKLVEVVDGDTQDVVVDLGFHLQRQIRLRLLGVDTHETYGVDHDSEEYRRGKEETEFVAAWLDEAATQYDGEWPLIVRTEKKGKYGRYLATIERRSDGTILNETLRRQFDGIDARDQEGS